MGLDYHSFGAACWCQIASFLGPDFIFGCPLAFSNIFGVRGTRPNRSEPVGAPDCAPLLDGLAPDPGSAELVGTRRDPKLRTNFGEPGPRSGVRGTRRNPSRPQIDPGSAEPVGTRRAPAFAPLQPRNKHSRGVLSSSVNRGGC